MVELFDVQLLRLLEFQLWQLYRLFVQLWVDKRLTTRAFSDSRREHDDGGHSRCRADGAGAPR